MSLCFHEPAFCSSAFLPSYSVVSNFFLLARCLLCLSLFLSISLPPLFFCSLLPLQQIVKQATAKPQLSLPNSLEQSQKEQSPSGTGSSWVSGAFSEHPSSSLKEAKATGAIKWVWFPREPCVFWFPSSSLVIRLCALACLMHSPTIWNALIFQTIDFRLAENIVAWKESGLYLKSIVIFVHRLPSL